ncbi:MAG: hypothetical protein GIKADHBN_02481 [Phycisphaerales bacterium]|nr:hypothetical protein [Phycisphaerales bacterium]
MTPRRTSTLDPYQPGTHGPWDTPAVCHLLRRAGFQPSLAEIQAGLKDVGPAATARRLVQGEPETSRARELDDISGSVERSQDINAVRGWWLKRMARTSRPLHARMTVFWHNHFATSNEKVMSAPLMMRQLETIEALAMGRFEDLLLAMSRDPAMIIWLDGDSNIKGRPNENYARELFELFSLGVGNYTEQDIKEAARAFTGWHQRQGEFRFFERNHDSSTKTVLGHKGNLSGEDVVSIAVEQPACARFLATKLLAEFVTPHPNPDLVDAFSRCLRDNDLHIGNSLEVLLASRAMFDPAVRRARIKSPVEFVVGACRSLETKVPVKAVVDSVNQMGQRLLEPPSVKGWNGHRAWINSSTMLLRLTGVQRLTAPDGAGMLDAAQLRSRHGLDSKQKVLEFCRAVTLDSSVPPEVAPSIDSLEGQHDGQLDTVLREALRILMSTPEYQLA